MKNFDRLEALGQTHLLRFFPELHDAQKQKLIDQINSVDLSLLDELKAEKHAESAGELAPLGALEAPEIEQRKEEFESAGIRALQEKKIAAVLLGGGQGTRLGYAGPKGSYDIGVNRPFYIFEAQFQTMLKNCRKAGTFFHVFLMTSDKNDVETRAFLKKHAFFGYPEEMVHFFVQDMAPSCDFEGKLLLEDKDSLSLSPNGNGGWYRSLIRAGYGEMIQKEGIEWFNVFAVDNVLQQICDPVFIGATLLSGANCGAKVVRKNAPGEKVGALCLKGGKPDVVEYYEMGEELAAEKDETGQLKYRFGVILNYLFNAKKMNEIMNDKMPIHMAKKKIPHIDENGNFVKPEKENGIKFEYLATDTVRGMETCLPFEVVREKEFAPIKNPTGIDSVESARALLQQNGVEL